MQIRLKNQYQYQIGCQTIMEYSCKRVKLEWEVLWEVLCTFIAISHA